MAPGALKLQIFLGLFFLLMTANAIFCHAVGREFIETAQQIRLVEAAGGDPQAAAAVDDRTMGGGNLLILLNLPFFGALGLIVRAADPSMGFLYWGTLLLGSTYLPLFISLCLFFLAHPPSHPSTYPGVEWEDGEPMDDDPKEDDDDRQRPG